MMNETENEAIGQVEISGLFTGQDELQVRRVLRFLAGQGVKAFFVYDQGDFMVLTHDQLDPERRTFLAKLSRTVANTDLKALPLQSFTKGNLLPMPIKERAL